MEVHRKNGGSLVISLDFELMWGVRDVATINSYGPNVKGVHEVLPKILKLFEDFSVSGTFAAVGFLFFNNKADLMQGLPAEEPSYCNSNLSPYGNYIQKCVGDNAADDPYHFGGELIDLIKKIPGQEIGTHTFSHYYCLEPGQTATQFQADIAAAFRAADTRGISLSSIIFPRNQVSEPYLEICKAFNIKSYRGTESSRFYTPHRGQSESLFKRVFRTVDAYVNLTGHHCYHTEGMLKNGMVNIPSSRFLRPYSRFLSAFEPLRLRRIKKAMTHAAKTKSVFHLWWHPHNFGINSSQNLGFLRKILEHYRVLNGKYNFTSVTMTELAETIISTQKGQVPANFE